MTCTYNVESERGLSTDGNVESLEIGPRFGRSGELGLCSENGSSTSCSVDTPSEKGESGDDGGNGFDEEQPSHLSGMDHDQRELNYSQLRPDLSTYESKRRHMQSSWE